MFGKHGADQKLRPVLRWSGDILFRSASSFLRHTSTVRNEFRSISRSEPPEIKKAFRGSHPGRLEDLASFQTSRARNLRYPAPREIHGRRRSPLRSGESTDSSRSWLMVSLFSNTWPSTPRTVRDDSRIFPGVKTFFQKTRILPIRIPRRGSRSKPRVPPWVNAVAPAAVQAADVVVTQELLPRLRH